MLAVSALLLATAIFVYFYFKELRETNHGASVKYLLIGVLFMYLSVPLLQLYGWKFTHVLGATGICIGFVLTFLWMSVLSFDLWRAIM